MWTQLLRRAHYCQIRLTSSLDSPECAMPAFELRDKTNLWVCEQHLTWVPKDRQALAYPTLTRALQEG